MWEGKNNMSSFETLDLLFSSTGQWCGRQFRGDEYFKFWDIETMTWKNNMSSFETLDLLFSSTGQWCGRQFRGDEYFKFWDIETMTWLRNIELCTLHWPACLLVYSSSPDIIFVWTTNNLLARITVCLLHHILVRGLGRYSAPTCLALEVLSLGKEPEYDHHNVHHDHHYQPSPASPPKSSALATNQSTTSLPSSPPRPANTSPDHHMFLFVCIRWFTNQCSLVGKVSAIAHLERTILDVTAINSDPHLVSESSQSSPYRTCWWGGTCPPWEGSRHHHHHQFHHHLCVNLPSLGRE